MQHRHSHRTADAKSGSANHQVTTPRGATNRQHTARASWARSVLRATGIVALVAWLSGCSAVGVLNAITPSASKTVQTGVTYGTLPRQQLDIYQPKAAAPVAGWK